MKGVKNSKEKIFLFAILMFLNMKNDKNNSNRFMNDISLSNGDLKIINSLYEYHYQNDKWPLARAFRQNIGRRIVETVERRKGPRLIHKYIKNGVEFYKLTFIGFLYCPKADSDIDMLYRYIDFIKQEFKKNPEIQKVKSTRVEEVLKLSKDQSKRLIDLIDAGNIWGTSMSREENQWEAGIPDDIEDLIELESPKKYLTQHIKKYVINNNKQKQNRSPFLGRLIENKGDSSTAWKYIKSNYGLNQRTIALKINFIKDSFKRSVILRDIKDAVFALENNMPKIAVVLSGGVIEEILRCRLESKSIRPEKENFCDYIHTCYKNNIIKKNTASILDAIRDFRNLVHLRNEKSKKDAISRNEASTAINSIFTLIKDL